MPCGSRDIFVQFEKIKPDRLFISQQELDARFTNPKKDDITGRALRKYLAELHKTVRFVDHQAQVVIYDEN